MYNLYKYMLLLLAFASMTVACTHSHEEEDGHGHSHAADEQHEDEDHAGHHEDHEEHAENEVELTTAQINTIGLATGGFETIKISGFIKANGILDLPPDEFASVTAPAEGFVKTTRGDFLVGSYVKRGARLATLEHPDYMQLQQQYLELLAQLEFQEQEVERQQTLQAAEAGALKKLQEAEANLKIYQARREGLRQQLRYLSIAPEQVEEGNILSSIPLLAPISGYITKLNVHKGQFVRPDMELYEIVNNQHIHLELDLFEKDIAQLKPGQRITFSVPALGSEIFEGEVKLVGKSFNMANKTLRVHGHIKGKHPEFIRGLYLEAKIWLDDLTVQALPAAAVVLDDGAHYIFVQSTEQPEAGVVHYEKVQVKVGASDGEYLQVTPIEPLPENVAIVAKEAYFLLAEMMKGELEHHH